MKKSIFHNVKHIKRRIMKQYINEIINKKYNTNKGYLYLIELINKRFPTFHIDYEKLENLVIKEMDFSYFEENGVVAEYRVKNNEIYLLRHNTNNDSLFSEDELIESFLHELIHALTSSIDSDFILEGLNLRDLKTNANSIFVGLNEGITQYITNEVLGTKSDAYPVETKIAGQIATIIGEERLIKYYSENNIEDFIKDLKTIDSSFDEERFLNNIFILHYFLRGILSDEELSELNINVHQLLTDIQNELIILYKKVKRNDHSEFFEALINEQENEYFDTEETDNLSKEEIDSKRNEEYTVCSNSKEIIISDIYSMAQEMVKIIQNGEVVNDVIDDNGERIIVTKTKRGTYGYQVFEVNASTPHYYAEGCILITDLKKNTDSDGRILRYSSAKSRIQRNLVGYFYEYILDRGFHSFYLNIKMPKDSEIKVSQRMAGYDPQDPVVIIGCSFDRNKIYVAGDTQVIEKDGIKTFRIGNINVNDDGSLDVEKTKELLMESELAKVLYGEKSMSESELDYYYNMSHLATLSMFYNIYKSFGIPLPPNAHQINWLETTSIEEIDSSKKL